MPRGSNADHLLVGQSLLDQESRLDLSLKFHGVSIFNPVEF